MLMETGLHLDTARASPGSTEWPPPSRLSDVSVCLCVWVCECVCVRLAAHACVDFMYVFKNSIFRRVSCFSSVGRIVDICPAVLAHVSDTIDIYKH